MSFAAIRNTATSALTASQVRMQVAASNIANADTEGYTQKIAVQSATSSGGLTSSVSVTAITSAADKYLLEDISEALTALGSATVNSSYADSLQSLFGSVDSDDSSTSLATSLAELETALADLAATPESETLKTLTVDALDSVATELRSLSSSVQSLRADADDSIAASVETVNTQLNAIDELNELIALAEARGETTADLEDQRTTALQAIASEMDVNYYITSGNQMKIATSSGTTLLDSTVHELSYTAAAYVTDDTAFSGITVGGKDITGEISSGTIGALIDQRDSVLPAIQDELDALASALIGSVNTVYNQGTTLPAPTSLVSAQAVAEDDALSGSGTVRIAAVDSEGTLVSYADFDLDDYETVGDFVAAINDVDGLSAAIGDDGTLTITADDGSGIAIADIDSQIDGQGVSAYFGFNNLLTGDSALDIAVSADVLSTPGLLATATLSTDETLTIGSAALGVSSTLAAALQDAMSAQTEIGAAGNLGSQKTSFAEYAGLVIAGVASDAEAAETALASKETTFQTLADSYSSMTGVNVDEETARITELEQQYSTAAQLLTVLNDMFDALLSAVQ